MSSSTLPQRWQHPALHEALGYAAEFIASTRNVHFSEARHALQHPDADVPLWVVQSKSGTPESKFCALRRLRARFFPEVDATPPAS